MSATRILTPALALLIGCGAPEARKLPVTDQQRVLAVTSASALRDQFNARGCQAVYDEAMQVFRSQREKDWLAECEQLQANLGAWRSLTIQSTGRCGLPRQDLSEVPMAGTGATTARHRK